jgi:NADPH-dependent curcumin reductase CurA
MASDGRSMRTEAESPTRNSSRNTVGWALTAFHCAETIEESKGDAVLVVGATGGVGAYAVQLAAGRGAPVVASALPQDARSSFTNVSDADRCSRRSTPNRRHPTP